MSLLPHLGTVSELVGKLKQVVPRGFALTTTQKVKLYITLVSF